MPGEVVPARLLLIFMLVFADVCPYSCSYPCVSNPILEVIFKEGGEGPLVVVSELGGQGTCLVCKPDQLTDRFPGTPSQTAGRAEHRGTGQDRDRGRWG